MSSASFCCPLVLVNIKFYRLLLPAFHQYYEVICLFPDISIGFACTELKFCRLIREGGGKVCTFYSPGWADVAKKPMWMFDVDYTPRKNSRS